MKIYAGNLSYNVADTELNQLFGQYGKVVSVNIIKDKFTGESKGFGFVEMEDDNAGQTAIKELNDKEFQGRKLNVSVARPPSNKQDGGGRREFRGGGHRRG